MGTPLSSSSVASTYQALLKTSDNSPISSSMKRLSDGLGNDLPVWVSDKSITNNSPNGLIENTVFGRGAMANATNASNATDNSAYGYNALGSLITGYNNIAIGSNAIGNTDNPTFNIAIGISAAVNVNNSRCLAIGHGAITGNASGAMAIGHSSNSLGSGSIAIGDTAVAHAGALAIGNYATTSGSNQIAIGSISSPLGDVTTETVSSTRTWAVTINGVARKILLA